MNNIILAQIIRLIDNTNNIFVLIDMLIILQFQRRGSSEYLNQSFLHFLHDSWKGINIGMR